MSITYLLILKTFQLFVSAHRCYVFVEVQNVERQNVQIQIVCRLQNVDITNFPYPNLSRPNLA
jgi:hypothetical protein